MTKTHKPVIPSQLADELNQAFASAEAHTICRAIGQALRDFNVSEISKKTGVQRTSIYRAFGNEQLPNFSTVLGVLTAMGLQLKVTPMRGGHERTPAPPDQN
ncbi:addiction module antidote protein [Bradyrhizobium niftali]|uniref:addiction module antidote protein n=1 Tax=Bradyrhizobium niftali TaxID=2560055 RepID=UPI00142F41C6|nr:addiction module antidote protein [Bradyrhizobium niftali]